MSETPNSSQAHPTSTGKPIRHLDHSQRPVIIHTLLLILLACGYALLVSGFVLLLGKELLTRQPWIIGLIVFISALAFLPLRSNLVRLTHSWRRDFDPGQIQAFSRNVTQASSIDSTLRLLRQAIQDNLAPGTLHIFIFDPMSVAYTATADFSATPPEPTSDLRFHNISPLVQFLSERRKAIFLGDAETLPVMVKPDQARIAVLGPALYVPIPGSLRLIGWVATGARKSSEEQYDEGEVELLEALCAQAALALDPCVDYAITVEAA